MINGGWSDKRANRFDHVVYPLLFTMVCLFILLRRQSGETLTKSLA